MNLKFKEAATLFQKGHIEKAENICSEIRRNDPKNFNNLNLLSIILFQKKKFEDALKILKESGITIEDMELIAVSEDKDTPSGLEKKYDLFNVPTLIFSKDNKELNRIVEFPIETLEKDMLSILKDDGYKNAYAK